MSYEPDWPPTATSVLAEKRRARADRRCIDWYMDSHSSRAYWDRVAHEKTFRHELRLDWMRAYGAGTSVLDCGCGYGRLLAQLVDNGSAGAVGSDYSASMLARCGAEQPRLTRRLVQADSRALPFRDESFDAVLLFTLLTSMPRDCDQRDLLQEARRVLRPGGLIYISDLLLNEDARNAERYQEFAAEFGTFGVFRLPEGVTVRHHSEEWIRELTGGFVQLKYERFSVTTMNGNSSAAFQYLGRLSK